MNKTELKFAIIGCGRIAQRHAEHIQKVGKLQAVCDVVTEKADALGNKYQSNIYYSLAQLLENEKELDVISICSPNGLHVTHAITVLNAGIRVLCVKPMAISSYDCGEMIKTA